MIKKQVMIYKLEWQRRDKKMIKKHEITKDYVAKMLHKYTNEELRQVIINMLHMFEEITIKGDNQNE